MFSISSFVEECQSALQKHTPPDAIHAIANPLESTTIGIHVYLGNLKNQRRYLWNPFTREKEIFDLDRFFAYERRLNANNA